jgi:predicted nucleic acid-binding protein
MKYVIDASTAFQWEVPEPDSLKAIQLREDYRNGIHELISPDIFPAEVGNALIVAERKGRIVAGQFAVRLTAILAGRGKKGHH